MIGGHGTSGGFAPDFEALGAVGALSAAMAAATFGLISGGLIGGPVARNLVRRYNLAKDLSGQPELNVSQKNEEPDTPLATKKMFSAAYQIAIAMGIGTVIYLLFKAVHLTFPTYMGGMLMGLILRNISDMTGRFNIPLEEVNCLGEISLTLFVSMALMTLRLWELAALAIPLIVMLTTQVICMALFTTFIAFRILGKDYDAAVMVSGICGFGLGAMPNAVANMQSFTQRFGPSPTAFFVVPAIGSIVIDLVNSFAIMGFMNILK